MLIADSVGFALLVVLETLSPAERLAFVLHDMFGMPFEEIAPIVERNVEATRQLASRARRRVRRAEARPEIPSVSSRQRVVDAFLAASRRGDFAELLDVLDPEVVFRADRRRTASRARSESQAATPSRPRCSTAARRSRTSPKGPSSGAGPRS